MQKICRFGALHAALEFSSTFLELHFVLTHRLVLF